MTVKHLDHLNLTVSDLEASVAWYRRALGFVPVESGLYEGQPWAIVRSGEAMLALYQRPGRHHPGDDERGRLAQLGLNHFGLRITDRPTWEKTIEEQGIEVAYGGPVQWPHSTSWYVEDPDGYEIEVALWDRDRVAFDAA
jgi:catechol 2,3-dioxygenase-like lactoylglutathione lyase family enzyme